MQAQFSVLSFAGAHQLLQDKGCYLWFAHLFPVIKCWPITGLSKVVSPPRQSSFKPFNCPEQLLVHSKFLTAQSEFWFFPQESKSLQL